MKNKYMHTLVVLALSVLFAGTHVSVNGQEIDPSIEFQTELHKLGIEGVWRTVVTPRNCQTGDPIPNVPQVRGLFTFHQGGTMSEWGVRVGASPAGRGPGHGLWRRLRPGRDDFAFTFILLNYDPSGMLVGAQKITALLELGPFGNNFTSSSSVQGLDVNDNVITTGCATAVGTRFG